MLNKTTQTIIEELHLQDLTPEEQQEVLDKMQDHFADLMMRIMVARLNEEQFERFKKALVMTDELEREAHIAALASEVPGLADELDRRIAEEYELFKTVVK